MEIDDTPLRLADAVKLGFPNGGMGVPGLRREIGRGRLEVEVIAGKQFVTLRAIRAMRELCRVPARDPRPRSIQSADVQPVRSLASRDVFLKKLRAQRADSRNEPAAGQTARTPSGTGSGHGGGGHSRGRAGDP